MIHNEQQANLALAITASRHEWHGSLGPRRPAQWTPTPWWVRMLRRVGL